MKRRFSSMVSQKRKSRKSFRPRGEGKPAKLPKSLICALLLLGLVLGKLLLPHGLGTFGQKAAALLDWSMDVKSAFSALGRAAAGEQTLPETLQDVYTAVFSPGKVQEAAADGLQEPLVQTMSFQLENGSSALELLLPLPAEAAAETSAMTQSITADRYVYTEENLPQKVSMYQKILGINYISPTQGELTSGFGYRIHPIYGNEQFHYGIDIANDSGTEIYAFADGAVQAVGESSMLGKYLILSHANHVQTLYAHCSSIDVSQGQQVEKGSVIAQIGSTGISTGPHLHFEVHLDGVYLNPIYYVDLEE